MYRARHGVFALRGGNNSLHRAAFPINVPAESGDRKKPISHPSVFIRVHPW